MNVSRLIEALLRMSSEMSRGLVIAAGLFVAIFLGISYGSAIANGLFISWLLFALAVVLTVSVGVFAWRRHRLSKALDEVQEQVYVSSGTVSASADAAEHGTPADPFIENVYVETELSEARFFPRVEAAQRAMVRSAGGTVNAPYLKDDLRITMVSFIGTLAAVPLAFSGGFIALLIWLLA